MRSLGVAGLVFLALLAITDLVTRAAFPHLQRLDDNFSPAYFEIAIERLRDAPPTTVFLGDSVLWGYKLRPDQAAPALLAGRGVRTVNLAYEGGSPVNTYAVLTALLSHGVRPKLVVFNVNQKVFNAADSAYATVHPSVAPIALPQFSTADSALVTQPKVGDAFEARIDRGIASVWRLYALRTDVRELVFGDVDAAHALSAAIASADGSARRAEAAHAPTPDRFEGTYDLSPLDATNVSVHFLDRIVALLRTSHVPAVAILTPTNHTLLHEYIDAPQYTGNLAYVRRMLERGGVRVIDLDRAFPASAFIDNDHLTAAGNVRLAALLARTLART